MSNLLFDERPLVIQPTLAKLLGSLDEAVILQQIHYWLEKKTNIKDGRSWVYNSMTDWQKQFPWLSLKTVKRKFKSLEDKGLLITANYNQYKFDRTKWYSIDYQNLLKLADNNRQKESSIGSSCPNGKGQVDPMTTGQSDPTNTIDYQETTPKTTTDILSGKPDGIPYLEIVDYLNQKTGKKFKSTTDKTKRLIKARFNEGFGVADFKQVVDNQTQAWLHDSKMAKYLRPETLFGPKFESYLNARPAKQQGGGGINGVYF
ncbi:hypothetical protein SN811_01430 [Ligilactobacillus agilis]|uniref:Phage conserved hypothetical protein C-terminal domain-containing protein n=1 Tax=Ligilactobacillus agilis TaxID=1601 RepID=A0A6F9Y260_9LACO|nr:conserved phage C-terminal domain-containing protein [Ligilactobacillus agilis]GET11643.1 hypothetical protein SN811_01430 [Ligilactobacillus agilis]